MPKGKSRQNVRVAVGVAVGCILTGTIIVVFICCLRKKKLKSQRLYGKCESFLILLSHMSYMRVDEG